MDKRNVAQKWHELANQWQYVLKIFLNFYFTTIFPQESSTDFIWSQHNFLYKLIIVTTAIKN